MVAWGELFMSAAEEALNSLLFDHDGLPSFHVDLPYARSEEAARKYAQRRRQIMEGIGEAREVDFRDAPLHDRRLLVRMHDEAFLTLSLFDPVYVDTLIETCDMLARTRDRRGLGKVLPSAIRHACFVYGDDSSQVNRVRAARVTRTGREFDRHERDEDKAYERLHKARETAGLTGAATLKATLGIIRLKADAFESHGLRVTVNRILADLRESNGERDQASVAFAIQAATECRRAGAVAPEASLTELIFTQWRDVARAWRADDPESFDPWYADAAMHLRLADVLVLTGDAERAEPLVRQALTSVEECKERASGKKEYQRTGTLIHTADFALGTVLLKRGRWDAAHVAFASAFEGLSDRTPQARLLAVHYRTAVTYTHRRWRDY